jgi:aminoglycoside phosphotransferase
MESPKDDLPTLGVADAWAMLREPVDAVTALGMGNRSRVYRAALRDGGTRIVRLTARGSGRVERERAVRAMVGADPRLPTVHEVFVRDHPLAASCDVVLMRELPGETMHAALLARPDAVALGLWRQYGEGLCTLHGRRVEGFGLLGADGRGAYKSWREAMEAAAARALRDARATALADLCDVAETALAARATALDGVTEGRLLHGDPSPLNVLTLGGQITAWIDFEYASAGDPLYELAFVASLFEAEPTNPFAAKPLTRWCESFADGYTALGNASDDEGATQRSGFYRLLHALRASEFLRVAGPRLPAAVRDAVTATMRAQVARRSA